MKVSMNESRGEGGDARVAEDAEEIDLSKRGRRKWQSGVRSSHADIDDLPTWSSSLRTTASAMLVRKVGGGEPCVDRSLHARLDACTFQDDVESVRVDQAVLGEDLLGRELCSFEASSDGFRPGSTREDMACRCEALFDSEIDSVLVAVALGISSAL